MGAQAAELEQPESRRTAVVFREVPCKSALNRVRGMPFEWSLNPYKGCAHACRYCFARAYHVRMDRDVGSGFDREIEVKINFPETLRAELRRGVRGAVALGTATDPYQPCEGKYRLTRRSLEALADLPLPLSIVTKSSMIVRDADLLATITRKLEGDLRVYFSVPTLDEDVWRRAEPSTPHPRQRLRALERLRAAGIDAGVLCAPVLPGLTDGEESLDVVARAASEHGATFFGWRPLKLDPEIRAVPVRGDPVSGRDAQRNYRAADRSRAASTRDLIPASLALAESAHRPRTPRGVLPPSQLDGGAIRAEKEGLPLLV
jgi:DNA repair photolyase